MANDDETILASPQGFQGLYNMYFLCMLLDLHMYTDMHNITGYSIIRVYVLGMRQYIGL